MPRSMIPCTMHVSLLVKHLDAEHEVCGSGRSAFVSWGLQPQTLVDGRTLMRRSSTRTLFILK